MKLSTVDLIKELATQAYGHGSVKAGSGRIGMVGDHVVKFNTHIGERWSKKGSMDDMRASCDALRSHLGRIVSDVYRQKVSNGFVMNISVGMKKVLAELGMGEDGAVNPSTKDLLTRKAVVKFIDQLKTDVAKLDNYLDGVCGGVRVKHSMLVDMAQKTVEDMASDAVAKAYREGGLLETSPTDQEIFKRHAKDLLLAKKPLAEICDDECLKGLPKRQRDNVRAFFAGLALRGGAVRLENAKKGPLMSKEPDRSGYDKVRIECEKLVEVSTLVDSLDAFNGRISDQERHKFLFQDLHRLIKAGSWGLRDDTRTFDEVKFYLGLLAQASEESPFAAYLGRLKSLKPGEKMVIGSDFENKVRVEVSKWKLTNQLEQALLSEIISLIKGALSVDEEEQAELTGKMEKLVNRSLHEFGVTSFLKADQDKRIKFVYSAEENGFGWLMDGTKTGQALAKAIRNLKPTMRKDESQRLALRILAGGFKDEIRTIVKKGDGFTMSFAKLVEKHVQKQAGREQEIKDQTQLSPGELAAQLEEELDGSKYQNTVGAGSSTEEDIIRDNLRIIARLNEKAKDLEKHIEDVMNEQCDGLEENERQARAQNSDFINIFLTEGVAGLLELKTVRGKDVALHLSTGLPNFLAAVDVGKDFANLYAKAKASGKLDDLYIALKEDGCLQARMGALSDLKMRLDYPMDDEPVMHSIYEDAHGWLLTELCYAARKIAEKEDGPVSWSKVKERLASQVRGKTFKGKGASVFWSPQNIYRYLDANRLELAGVEVDESFKDKKQKVESGDIVLGEV